MIANIWYYLDEHWDKICDPRVKNWSIISGGIWKVLLILSVYLMITLVLLPRFMKHRRPYELKNVLLAYNVFMVIANAYFFILLVFKLNFGKIFLDFNYPSTSDETDETKHMLNAAWYVMITRYIDLADTAFFVLRKKQSQITFLHIYHHTIVPLVCWVCFKYNIMIPYLRFIALLNTLIHTIMYGYYALAALGPRFYKYLWWKKYLTTIQILQFVADVIYGVILYFNQKNYPMSWFWFVFGQLPFLLILFVSFYVKTYTEKSVRTRMVSKLD